MQRLSIEVIIVWRFIKIMSESVNKSKDPERHFLSYGVQKLRLAGSL